MKKFLVVLTLFFFAGLLTNNADAQIRTVKGDFFNITRTVEQTADSVEFIADTMKVVDTNGGVADFIDQDSVCVMFVQNRFKVVNNVLGSGVFDYVRAYVTLSTGMSLSRQAYPGDPAQLFQSNVGLKPVHRPVGNIASTSNFNSGPSAIRQVLTFRVNNPSAGRDGFGLRRILFKPNINNLTGLAIPPDTTKDTLRAYLLDAPTGNVVNQTDLAIVRLLPGTTRILVWVNDSAQSIDAGEYIGSFGDYSRGRYFLGDDGLPLASSVTPELRPSTINPITGGPNPDYGLIVDGFPPEANSIRTTNLFNALAAGGNGTIGGGYNCSPPNPQYGLIPPYRVGAYAVPPQPYQSGLVSSGVDTIRFLDAWGNRTWDMATQPQLRALAWNVWATQNGTPVDRTIYLKGYQDRDDTLRQVGQMVYRRLSYTHADLDGASGIAVADSVQIFATAVVRYLSQGGIPAQLNAVGDTSGGFPRTSNLVGLNWSIRRYEGTSDNNARISGATSDDNGHLAQAIYEPDRTPVNPAGLYAQPPSLPPTGVKIVVRPNIPRRIQILPKNIITNTPVSGMTVGDKIKFEITVVDGYGNTVDDNERFKFEISPFSPRLGGFFDSLTMPAPSTAGVLLDSGRVSVALSASVGAAVRGFSAATGSNNAGSYRIRVRSSFALNDRFNDLNDPLKRDPAPGPGFNHVPDIPDGSPNNNFGVWFGPGAIACGSAGFGNWMGQTTAIDSIEIFAAPSVPQKVEMVCGDSSFVVDRTGTYMNSPYKALYVRATDIFSNPVSVTLGQVQVWLPNNPAGMNGDKDFRASVSRNVARSGANGIDNPLDVVDANGNFLDAETISIPVGGTLPDIIGDVPAVTPYTAVRYYFRAPKNVNYLNLLGEDEIPVMASISGPFSFVNSSCTVKVRPDVVQVVEVFKSVGKPQGSTEPVPWAGGTTSDREAAGFPVGTPQDASEAEEMYKGYFFRASDGTVESQTTAIFPTPEEPGATIGSFGASASSEDLDATAPIPLDTVTVSRHDKQIRLIARLLDRFRNPVGGRWVKFWTLNQTIPITPPKTVVQDNAQRGGFGEFGDVNVSDDTLKKSTVGDTAQSGWVSAYFISGRVGWQIVRVALTPDTMAYDLAYGLGDDLGEGTVVGTSRRGYAPRVIIPVYQKSDTTVRCQLYPYTAAPTSPIPLPQDAISIQRYEHVRLYDYPCPNSPCKDDPWYQTYSAVPVRTELRRIHSGRFSGADIRPYIPDTLNLTATTGANAITAGRIVTILAREYDQFNNLVDNMPVGEDTARIRFRMWGDGWSDPPSPYRIVSSDPGAGTIAPAANWTRDEWGPMRKARYRHTQISNLVAGVHINQTAYLIGLEYPTPKIQGATVYFEATATAVLPGKGPVNLNRDTVKIVSVTKQPTRFDILRAGQDWALSGFLTGTFNLDGAPEARIVNATIVGLPAGADPIYHSYDAWGVDNILVSQVYQRNISQELVGLYEVVNEDNVPLDKKGNAMFLANGTINSAFEGLVKLPAYNNQNPSFDPFYNLLNNTTLQTRVLGTTVPGARFDGAKFSGAPTANYVFDVTIAGGGDGIGANIDWQGGYDSRRPFGFRITPVWENASPTGPALLTIDGRAYGRLYADSVYTYGGRVDANAEGAKGEIMGTRTDRGDLNLYRPSFDKDRITRMGTGFWSGSMFNAMGFPGMSHVSSARVNMNPISSGTPNPGQSLSIKLNANGGTFNRRMLDLAKVFSRGSSAAPYFGAPGYIAPGAFFAIIDSTTEQVLDLRVYDKALTDANGVSVDDTCSYDQGKRTVIRTNQNTLRHLADTYFGGSNGIQGPNANTTVLSDTRFPAPNELPPQATEPLATRQHPGLPYPNWVRHTVVVIPYRVAFTSIFPSSYDVSQNLFDLTRLPLGILPRQTDIDTLPRVTLIPPPGADLTKFELFTRLYGQVQHGATAQIPLTNPNETGVFGQTPYARPDTTFRDITYTYAVTPYDRYGNLNTRDTVFVNIGARFSDWDFLDLGTGAGANLTVRSGGQFFRAIPRNTPTNEFYRHDTLRIFNPRGVTGSNRNDFLGVKPDDDELSLSVGRAKPPFGTGTSVLVPHGILAANIIGSRPVDVKKPFPPAPFTLSTSTIRNTDLFRVDWTGCNVPTDYKKDTLRIRWQVSQYPSGSGFINPNDTIRYFWHGIIDSVYTGGVTSNQLIVRVKADNDGLANSMSVDGNTLWNLLFRPGVAPQPNGADSLVMRIRWYVTAENKVGMVTHSDTAGSTVRNYSASNPATNPLVVSVNRRPTCASNLLPPNNQVTTAVNATSTLTAQWNPGADVNLTKGNLIGGFKIFDQASLRWVSDPSRTVDTLTYQWRARVVRTFPPTKGAPVGYQIIVPAGVNGTTITIPANLLDSLFRGFSTDPTSTSADSVVLDWYVDNKDFNLTNGREAVTFDSTWSGVGCRPHICTAGANRWVLTKLDGSGIEIDPAAGAPDIQKLTGEDACFTVTAKDKNGNVVRNWNTAGVPVSLKLTNSTANTDTSAKSWNVDPKAYSWAIIKDKNGNTLSLAAGKQDEWILPPSLFVDGVTTICFQNTKAESALTITASPTLPNLKNISAKMNFGTNAISNYLVDLTPATAADNQVYVYRRYEIVVYPRDMYLNFSNQEVVTKFTARFPGEFDNTNVGSANIFAGDMFIKGPTNYFVLSTTKREKPGDILQTITAYSRDNNSVRGITDAYEILTHAPGAFNLQKPADQTVLKLYKSADIETFEWSKAVDPYTNIRISRFDPPTVVFSDVVAYKWVGVDSISLTNKLEKSSDAVGMSEKLTMNHGQLADVINQISGSTTTKSQAIVWWVVATDGLFNTLSTPPNSDPRPGFRLRIIKEGILDVANGQVPTEFTLDQNFPNPFNPSTQIAFSLPKGSQVSLVVYDLLGNKVKTLVNEFKEASKYNVTWDATNDLGEAVPTGTYVYKIVAGNFTATRKMTLLK